MKDSMYDDMEEEVTKKWYEEYPKESTPKNHSKTEVEVLDLKTEAKRHLEGETAAFQLKQSKIRNSEYEWLKTALTKGTSSDKVAASVVLVQDNPKYSLARLVSLVSQVKVSKQNQATHLITALRDLFLGDLLHPEYKLLKFEEQDLDKIPSVNDLEKVSKDVPRNKLLSHWYFEDQLREQYEKFLTNLSAVAADTVDANREKAVAIMTDLLIGNSEQEHKLLEFLVNKIGDPRSKVASKAVFCLNKLLHEHPNMKIVVLKEVEKLLFRTNMSQRAQYYAICLLTQFVLDREDTETATNLIDVYFAFFKACLKKGEPDTRMMAAILTGVNRAYPFADLETIKLNDHIDSVYKVVHVGSFNVSLNALSLLHQVVGKNPEQANRFYTAFYRKLFDLQIGVANKRAVFLNLLYRVMKNDKNPCRVFAFIKRVCQVAVYYPACMACATLYVISQVIQSRKDLKQMLSIGPVIIKKEKEEDSEDNSEEKKENSDDSDDDAEILKPEENSILLSNVTSKSAEAANNIEDPEKKDVVKLEEDNNPFYDPFALNPLRSGAIKAPVAELASLLKHFHPTVALFAANIIEGKKIDYTGDPLEDLTVIRFLDRYVFKNPKKIDEKKVVKTNDPLAVRAKYIPKGLRSVPVESQAYLNEDENRIPVDELFLYKYLKKKNDGLRSIEKEDEDDESDNDSVNSEEFNDMMDQLSGGKDFEELDIAADIGSSKKKKGGLKDLAEDDDENESNDESEEEEEEEDIDAENDDDDDDDGLYNDNGDSMDDEDLDNMSDLGLDEIDDDMSDIDFDDSDDEVKPSPKKPKKSVLPGKNKSIGKGKKSGLDSNVFVSAEEFAEMLEQQGRSKQKQGGSNTFSDADGASVKQLDWEIGRNQKISGKFGGKKRSFNNNKGFKGNKNVKKFKR